MLYAAHIHWGCVAAQQLVNSLSPYMSRFRPWSFHIIVVMDVVELKQVFLGVFPFSAVSIILLALPNHSVISTNVIYF
jgi:hypothetical protein